MPNSPESPPGTPAAVALHARGLVRSFGDRRAVDGLDLTVRRGECLGLLGPNGAGKSTSLRMFCARLSRHAGELKVLGLDPSRDGEALRARIGLVPQDLALYDDLTARENLRLFGALYRLSGRVLDEAVARALEAAGLLERADDRVGQYSGGMKRRLNVVAGTLHDPELVLLDEPTVGIDPQSRTRIFELVEALRSRGTTLIYTSHALGEVERLCDRIAILDTGRMLACGSLAELQARHRRAPSEPSDGELRLGDPTKTGTAIRLLQQAGIAVNLREPAVGLEEVFLGLTGRKLRDEEVR
ncbi:MAG: ABC transporter ATP-binding protein [Planctomycetes bacterium]|nr:ABC transporter ATP-binding protein [Planctomycetota bacterium]